MATGARRSLAQQRHQRITREVRARGSVRVVDLAALLGVSDMTVRRDLDILHDDGQLVKVHGGAIALAGVSSDEPGFDAKSRRNVDEKLEIARRAARLVQPGGTVGLTAGTTTWRLAAELVDVENLTIVTNSIRVAEVIDANPRPDRQLIMTGGVRTPSDALVGPIAVSALRALHVDTLFVGVHGMSERAGFTTPNLLESDTNRAFFDAAGHVVVLADHTKWNVNGLSSFGDLAEAGTLLTDSHIDADALATLRTHIDEVIVVENPSDQPITTETPRSA